MVLLEYKLHKNIEMGDLMGLLDLIFGRKNKPAEDNTDSNMLSETSRPIQNWKKEIIYINSKSL